MGLHVSRLRAEEMGKFERNCLVIAAAFSGFELHAQLVKLDGQEVNGHVSVECFGVRPALHAVPVGQFLVH